MLEAQDMDTVSINGPWQLPERWEWIQIQNLVHLDTKTINPSDTPETVFLYLGLENIEKGQWDIASYQTLTGKEIKSSCILFGTEHILYSKLRPNLNKVVVWWSQKSRQKRTKFKIKLSNIRKVLVFSFLDASSARKMP